MTGAVTASRRHVWIDGQLAAADVPHLSAFDRGFQLGDGVFETLRARAGDRAWDALVAAILLQSDAGGDLAGLLRDLATRLEEARRAEGEARAATAQARFTAGLVAALPAGAAVLAELASPGFLAGLLRSPVSAVLVAASAALQVLALLTIRRIGRAA